MTLYRFIDSIGHMIMICFPPNIVLFTIIAFRYSVVLVYECSDSALKVN